MSLSLRLDLSLLRGTLVSNLFEGRIEDVTLTTLLGASTSTAPSLTFELHEVDLLLLTLDQLPCTFNFLVEGLYMVFQCVSLIAELFFQQTVSLNEVSPEWFCES
jgi:hypothetical protein